jgi:hypothetical protein
MESGLTLRAVLPPALFLLSLIGGLIWVIGHVGLIIQGFRVRSGWGLAILLFGPLSDILFTINYWVVAKKPFFLSLIGAGILVFAFAAGALFSGHTGGAPAGKIPEAPRAAAIEAPFPSLDEDLAPSTDQAKVAGMLKDAGIDPNDPHTFHGRTIQEMTKALGAPSATMKAGREVTYIFYNCFEVVSVDGGKTVSAVHYMGK